MRTLRSRGFTLLEMMVAVFIFSLVMIGAFKAFETQQRTYITESLVTEMQQNTRISLDRLARDARMAGFLTTGVGALAGFNNNAVDGDNVANGTDAIEIVYSLYNSDEPVVPGSYSEGGGGGAANMKLDNPAAFGGIDLVGLRLLVVADTPCSDGERYKIIEITQQQQIGGGGDPDLKVNFSPGLSSVNLPGGLVTGGCKGTGFNPVNAYLVRTLLYYVDNEDDPDDPDDNDDPEQPKLMVNGFMMAENVEDLQFAYTLDADRDGIIDDLNNNGQNGDAGDWLDDPTGSEVDISSVRISVLGRTERELVKWVAGARPAIEDHAGGGADAYRRRLFATEVRVRNLAL